MKTKKPKTRYGLLIILSIIVSVLVISSVSAVPYTQAKTNNDVATEQINKIMNSRLFQRIKNIVSPQINDTIKEQLRAGIINIINELGYSSFPALVEFLITIAAAIMFLLGHGVVGQGVALLVVSLIGLPVLMAAMLPTVAMLDITVGMSIVFACIEQLDLTYQFGLIGSAIILICLVPVVLILMVLAFIPAYILLTLEEFINLINDVGTTFPQQQ